MSRQVKPGMKRGIPNPKRRTVRTPINGFMPSNGKPGAPVATDLLPGKTADLGAAANDNMQNPLQGGVY